MDRLLKTRPTLILDVALEDETVANLMTQLGVRRVRVPCATLDDIPTAILTVGRNSFVSEIVALAGGRNLGDEVTNKDYFPVSSEWVIARNPDIILCLYMAEGGGGEEKQTSNIQRRIKTKERSTKPRFTRLPGGPAGHRSKPFVMVACTVDLTIT